MKTKLLMTAVASIAALSATSASAQSIESIREVVYYNFNSAQSAEVEAQMQKIIDLASSRNAQSIQVVCHTDTTGSAAYNQGLSERRAADVRSALVARGISSNIISSSGLGETSPLVPTADNVKEQLNRRCEIDLQVDAVVEYSEPVQTYTQPAQTYTETVVEQAPYQAPTPIESTQVVTQAPYQAPTPVTTTVPSTPVASTPVASAPSVPASTPPPLPPVSTGGGVLGGISTPVLIGGIGAIVAAGILIADGDDDDDEPNSP